MAGDNHNVVNCNEALAWHTFHAVSMQLHQPSSATFPHNTCIELLEGQEVVRTWFAKEGSADK